MRDRVKICFAALGAQPENKEVFNDEPKVLRGTEQLGKCFSILLYFFPPCLIALHWSQICVLQARDVQVQPVLGQLCSLRRE